MPVVATLEQLGVGAIRDTITAYRDAVRAHAEGLNRLNVYPVPDGDTGTNMARTLDAVVAEMAGAAPELAPTCHAIAHGSLMGARGNSGVILSQILRGLSVAFEQAAAVDPPVLASALVVAASEAYKAVLKPVEGTILTVVREAAAAAERAALAGGTLVEVLGAARGEAQSALEHTPELLPVLKTAGVVDAGGAGFVLLLDAALHVVDGRPLPEPAEESGSDPAPPESAAEDGPRYEVMYFLDLPDEHIDGFRQSWGDLGESVVVVGGDGLWNCHVHTDDIGAALEAGLVNGGRPSRIRVTDLLNDASPVTGRESLTSAVVAVAVGDGLRDLFRQAGVAATVAGGQTMNPSTAELLSAVEAAKADQVLLLPNNANVIPVARQVDALTAKTVRVVPTRSAPEALAALVAYDPDETAEANATTMSAAIASVVTGEVTRAVRAATSPVGTVRVGDWIGLVGGGGIVAVGSTLASVATDLLGAVVTAQHELVTIIEGADATDDVTEAITCWLETSRPSVQLERHYGGQPLYPYLFGAE